MAIGKLESVPLRELWKHEEHGFSAWLKNNIEILSETLGISLSGVQLEKTVGSFQVDLVAEDDDGNPIIIENQLEPTDHDHLGKLLTYLTNLEAKTAIWITSEPRPEHIRAVAWLNEVTPEDIAFYLVRIEACRIGNSDPAPRFTVIIAPSKEAKELGEERKDIAKQHELNKRFWEQLLTRAEERGVTLHAERFPIKGNALNVNAGKPGLSFGYVIWPEDEEAAVQLFIEMKAKNKYIFDLLCTNRKKIKADFGDYLEWERNDNSRYSCIRSYLREGPTLENESNWSQIQDKMIDKMDRLSKALKPHIQGLPDLSVANITDDIKPPIKVNYEKFWTQLLAHAKERGISLHNDCSPSEDCFLPVNAGKPGLFFYYYILPEDEEVRVQLYIDTEDKDTNKRFYDLLYTNKQKIETDFGGTLRWFLPGNRSYAYIRYPLEKQDLEHENNWSSIQYAMIDAMGRLSRALKPHIQALPE